MSNVSFREMHSASKLISCLKVFLTTTLTLLLFLKSAYAQINLPKVMPPPPEAAALGKFADIPVGLYNGIPQVEIPIYTISINNNKIPISLSYHASGIKVAEIPSSVGSGWALNCGGVITRTVRDKVDERDGYFTTPEVPRDNNCLTGSSAWEYLKNSSVPTFDTEPDMFYFNFNGITGKFVLDKKGKVHQIPYSNIKIEPTSTQLGAWKITTEDGIEYYFGTIEWNGASGSIGSYKSSWYLDSIKYPNSDQRVTFEYTSEHLVFDFPFNEVLYQFSKDHLASECQKNAGIVEKLYSYSAVSSFRISKINFPNGVAEFIPGNYRKDYKGARTLGSINISNNTGLIKNFKLSYEYQAQGPSIQDDGAANANTNADTGLRLSLKSVQEYGSDALTNKGAYVFKYYDAMRLPDRLTSKALDHWGYFNGSVGNTTLIPSHFTYNNIGFNGGNRELNEASAKAGILTEITYPTGGVTRFDYESNRAHTNLLSPNVPSLWGTSYRIGNCRYSSLDSFIVNESDGSINATITFRTNSKGDSYAITRQICNGNSTNSIPSSVASYIYFQIIDITDPLAPKVFYSSSSDNIGVGLNMIETNAKITIPNGKYRLKAVKGIQNLSINAPEITSVDANFTTSFLFELKGISYSRDPVAPGAAMVGGLRIKKMTDYDPIIQKSIIKTYDYTNDGKSSGVINWVPNYKYKYSEDYKDCYNNGPYTYYYDVYSSTSNLSLTQIQGGNVGYSKVTVFSSDDQNNDGINGKTEYYFNNPADYYFASNIVQTQFSPRVCFTNTASSYNNFSFPYSPSLSPDWAKGLLIKKIDYARKTNDTYDKIKEVTNIYKDDYLGPIYEFNPLYDVPAIKIGISKLHTPGPNDPGPYNDYALQYYYIPSRYSKLIKTEEITFNASAPVTTTKTFNYDHLDNLQLTQTSLTDSKGDIYKTTFKYSNDFPSDNIYVLMYSKNMINPVIEQNVYKNNVFLSYDKTNYKDWGNVIAPSSIESKILNDSTNIRLKYNKYNSNGNLLDVSKPQGPHVGYQWGYNKQYPIAQINNATDTEFYYEGYEEIIANGVYAGVAHTGKKFTTNTIVNWVKPNNRNYLISYWYRDNGTWKYMNEQPYLSNSFTLTNGDAYDDVRIYPKDAEITTFTYEPLVGVTSITDVKGTTTYYEYDMLQMLKNIKDQNGNIIKSYEYHYKP